MANTDNRDLQKEIEILSGTVKELKQSVEELKKFKKCDGTACGDLGDIKVEGFDPCFSGFGNPGMGVGGFGPGFGNPGMGMARFGGLGHRTPGKMPFGSAVGPFGGGFGGFGNPYAYGNTNNATVDTTSKTKTEDETAQTLLGVITIACLGTAIYKFIKRK